MILNAVVLVLREFLEAALVISVFLALSTMLKYDRRWIFVAFAFGFITATLYAVNLGAISMAFEGVGQEVFNATVHGIIYLSLILYVISIWPAKYSVKWRRVGVVAMIIAVTFATAREGAEVYLYISGFVTIPDMLTPVLMGGAVGAGIGASVGVFFYYLLVNLSLNKGLWSSYFIIVLLAGSMVSQAVQFLVQADIIQYATPVWDSSSLIAENSLAGQLLYALIGYEATPSAFQVKAYLLCILLLLCASVASWYITKKVSHE